jgi:aminoglycoside/choline kinase family phosphotransferase
VKREAEAFLSSALKGESYRWEQLYGDGSDRNFYRIRTGAETFILLEHLGGGRENFSYYTIGSLLYACGISVPRFEAHSPEGLFLLEDLGDEHLLSRVRGEGGADVEAWLRKAVDLLISIQEKATPGLKESFCFDTVRYDRALALNRESHYFRDAFLRGYLSMSDLPPFIEDEFVRLAAEVEGEEPPVFLHRDFQSRNLMIKNERLHVIDFQGSRFGPPHYDLAALLWDPYTDLSPGMRERLFSYYLENAHTPDKELFRKRFTYVGLHRAMQVLGAFGFLTRVKGKVFFERHIPAAVRNFSHFTNRIEESSFPGLAGISRRLETLYPS